MTIIPYSEYEDQMRNSPTRMLALANPYISKEVARLKESLRIPRNPSIYSTAGGLATFLGGSSETKAVDGFFDSNLVTLETILEHFQKTIEEINQHEEEEDISDISSEFDGIKFGDQRVDRRAIRMLASMYGKVGEGLAASFDGSSEIKAAYRFFDNDLVTPEKILESHFQKTIERIKQHKVVIFVQDTTDIDMKHMNEVENLGVLNDTSRPGCSLHPVIAFTPEKVCLGVLDIKFLIRPEEELGKKESNKSRSIEEKESYRWIEGYEVVHRIAEQCPGTMCVCIGDRESDIYELYVCANANTPFLVRARHNRSIEVPTSEDDESKEHDEIKESIKKLKEENNDLSKKNEKLRKRKNSKNRPEIVEERKKNSEKISANTETIKELQIEIKRNRDERSDANKLKHQLSQAPIYGHLEFVIPGRNGKKSRAVTQTVKARQVTFSPSRHKKDLPQVTMNAVLLEEVNTPEGEEPIVWMFLTSLPIDKFDDIKLIVKLYLSRWGIELFFKVLKSGCKIEDLRFQEASRLLSCIAMYMIVAWRVLYTTFIGRACPELPCSSLFDIDEWQSVYAVVKRIKPPPNPPNLGEFMKMVATLGGYRGRKSDGPPGMKVIWIGLQAMHRLAEGWRAHKLFS